MVIFETAIATMSRIARYMQLPCDELLMQPQEKCRDNIVSPPLEYMVANRAEYLGEVMRIIVMGRN